MFYLFVLMNTSFPQWCHSGLATQCGFAAHRSRNNDVAQNSDSVRLITAGNLVCYLLAVWLRAITAQRPADYGWLLCFRDGLIVGWVADVQSNRDAHILACYHTHGTLHTHTLMSVGANKKIFSTLFTGVVGGLWSTLTANPPTLQHQPEPVHVYVYV